MPYPFAHPAAVVPLHRLLGRVSVPSALAIGSVTPDLWYVLPLFQRHDSHSLLGLLFFCLPAGLAAYLCFHLLKIPLLALLPRALAERAFSYSPRVLPQAPWLAVCASLLLGAITHLAWDALTYDESYGRLVRHVSTILGGAFVFWWSAAKIAVARPRRLPVRLAKVQRDRIVAAMLAAGVLIGLHSAFELLPLNALDYVTVRSLARTAGIDVVAAVAWALVAYGLAWHLIRLARQPRR